MTLSRRDFHKALLGATAAVMAARAAAAQPTAITAVDSHAHVFRRGLPLADVRRYAPDYDATPEDHRRVLDAHGVSHGVLVQPSFLGTDNSYLVEALKSDPQRLRGIVVVRPEISLEDLRTLDRLGVVGLRLNLIGLPDPPLDQEPWPTLLHHAADLDWQVEVHVEARRLPRLLAGLHAAGVKIVVDHFGRPDAQLGVDDPGFRDLLAAGKTGRTWIKVSAAYRNAAGERGDEIARQAMPLLRDSFGAERLLWGSDWPHTQFERTVSYEKTRAMLDRLVPDAKERQAMLVAAPAELFRFAKR
jgi:predicted TIM-barrel fold metal-dependent hydrolase